MQVLACEKAHVGFILHLVTYFGSKQSKEGKHGQTNLCSVTARGQIQSSAVFNLLDND